MRTAWFGCRSHWSDTGPSLALPRINPVGNSTRRRLVAALGAGALASPFTLFAQQPSKVWRVRFFYFGSRQSATETGRYQQLLEGMRELGYERGNELQPRAGKVIE